MGSLREEIGDVLLCASALEDKCAMKGEVEDSMARKAARWRRRLERGRADGD